MALSKRHAATRDQCYCLPSRREIWSKNSAAAVPWTAFENLGSMWKCPRRAALFVLYDDEGLCRRCQPGTLNRGFDRSPCLSLDPEISLKLRQMLHTTWYWYENWIEKLKEKQTEGWSRPTKVHHSTKTGAANAASRLKNIRACTPKHIRCGAEFKAGDCGAEIATGQQCQKNLRDRP